METNFKVDMPSFALGYSAGKKKGGSGGGGKDPVLGELVVTENGVYDEPTAKGEVVIAWDGVVGDRPTIDYSSMYMLGVKVSDRVLTKDELVGAIAQASDDRPPITITEKDVNVTDIGTMASILVHSFSSAGEMAGIVIPEPGTYFLCNEQNYIESLTFSAPTPADGWNKVTVNVAGDIVDVSELPTENIEEGKIYRVTTVSEGSVTYYISDGATSQTLEELADSTAGPGQYIRGVYTIVDELPENPPDHDGSNMTVPVYVIRETGEGFVRTSDGLVPLIDMANMVFQVEYSYMGIVNTVGDMTQAGYYAIMTSGASSTTYGIPNANPVKRFVDGAWVELT